LANAYQLISIEQVDGLAAALEAAGNTPAEILASLLTVDGPGSGLNADLLDGYNSTDFVFTSSYTAADVLAKLITVDGSGSALDADLLDGQHGSYYNGWANLTGAPVYARASTSASLSLFDTGNTRRVYLYGDGDGQGFLNTTLGGYIFRMTASNPTFTISGNVYINEHGIWHAGNDGAGSTLDADLLDGQQGSYYQNADNLNAGTLLAARMPAFTGDATSTAGAVALTLATVNGNVGSFGSATAAPTFTVNAKGLITAAGSTTITPAWSSITSHPTTLAGYGITDLIAKTDTANVFTEIQTISGVVPGIKFIETDQTAPIGGWTINLNSGSFYIRHNTANPVTFATQNIVMDISNAEVVTFANTPSAFGNAMWHAGNDGASSGLDADLLDGQQGSYYQNAGNLNAGTILAARMPALTGDITTSAGAVATTLATVNGNVGSFGSATAATIFTVNAKGLITAASSTTITPAWSSITSKPTTISGYGITDAVARASFAVSPNSSVAAADVRNITNPTTGIGYVAGGRFRFSSLNDDATSPYADVIDLSTYADSTGGGFNALYFSKSSHLLRHKFAAAGATSWDTKTVAYTDSAMTGNTTGSAATLTTGRTIAITGDLTWTSPSFNGSSNITAAGTLATVNGNVGSFGSATAAPTFTVNAKGLITAAGSATITPAWSSITSKPTTLSGFGIVDAVKQATSATINGRAYDLNIAAVSGSGAAIGGWDRQLAFTGGSTDTTGSSLGTYGDNQTATYAYIGLGTISTQYTSTNSLRIYSTYAAWGTNVIWHAGNDGASSGLDADLLDGQQGSYYLSATNINAGTLSDSYLPATMAGKTFSSRVTVSGVSEGVRIASDTAYYSWYNAANNSRNGYFQHSGSTMTLANEVTNSNINITTTGTGTVRVNSNSVWHAGNDGAGSTLDADLLDGQQGSYYFPVSGGSFTGNISIVKASPSITINDTTYVDPSPLGLFRVYSAAGNLYITRNTATNRGYGTESSTVSISGSNGAWNFTSTPLVSGGALALIASPTFTGTPAAPTATAGTNTTQLATTAFVTTADNLKANVGGSNATGTWPISISGAAASVTTLTLGYSTSSVSLTAAMQNQLGYVAGVSLLGQTDGGLYQAGYDTTSWKHQIFGDFRTGQILIRGQNSGTFQAWRTVWDSGNDGAGSTLDADLLDGQQGAWYAPIASPTFTGTVTMPAFSVTSDQRLKTDIEPLQGYSEFLDATKIYSFIKDGKHQFGVLAHEAQEIRPELVSTVSHKELGEVMTVNPMDYLFALVAEVQDLRKRVAELESK